MDGRDIQRLLDNPDSLGRVDLPAGEYEGKFFIKKGCTVNGNGALLWNASGPVLVIDAENVIIKGLRIELTGSALQPEQAVSVYCRHGDTKFTDVEVNGAVLGIEGEEQFWGVPSILDVGTFEADKEHCYVMELYSPVEAELNCCFHDVTLSADILLAGYNSVTINVGKIRSGSSIYGNIIIRSAVERRIIFSGIAGAENTLAEGTILCTVDREAPAAYAEMVRNLDPVMLASMPEPEQEYVELDDEESYTDNYAAEEGSREDVFIESGKRIPLAPRKYKIELMGSPMLNMDIDAYLFMLDSNSKVSADKRMIFFGNDHSDCGSVTYLNAPDKRAMYIDFHSIPQEVSQIVMLYSIYGNNPNHLFDRLKNGWVSVLCENGVHMRLPLSGDIHYRTILALAFERTEGVWEMIPSGMGVGMALENICRSYGVTVVS